MEQVRFKGVPLYLNGAEYIIPSLSLRQVEEFDETLSQPVNAADGDITGLRMILSTYLPVIGAAIRRNYPEVKDEDLLDWLDLESVGEAIKIIQNASGYRTVRALGELPPAASTGETSTAV